MICWTVHLNKLQWIYVLPQPIWKERCKEIQQQDRNLVWIQFVKTEKDVSPPFLVLETEKDFSFVPTRYLSDKLEHTESR